VVVTGGSTAGSLTADSQASVTSNGITETVNYYDDIDISDLNGQVSETVLKMIAGSLQYQTTAHRPDGTIAVTTSATASGADANAIGFHRRWIIEKDSPIAGVRRITVLVTLENGFMNPPVTYQMSMVRP